MRAVEMKLKNFEWIHKMNTMWVFISTNPIPISQATEIEPCQLLWQPQ